MGQGSAVSQAVGPKSTYLIRDFVRYNYQSAEWVSGQPGRRTQKHIPDTWVFLFDKIISQRSGSAVSSQPFFSCRTAFVHPLHLTPGIRTFLHPPTPCIHGWMTAVRGDDAVRTVYGSQEGLVPIWPSAVCTKTATDITVVTRHRRLWLVILALF